MVHTVKEDETLAQIAEKYKTTVENLLALNKLTSAEEIEMGQKLVTSAEDQMSISSDQSDKEKTNVEKTTTGSGSSRPFRFYS